MEHDWCFFVMLPVTQKEARQALAGQRLTWRKVDPDSGAVRSAHIACYACEKALSAELLGQPCPGDPAGYDEEGVPFWN